MFVLINLEEVREGMLLEIQSDSDDGILYISERLNPNGKQVYLTKLIDAASHSDVDGFEQSLGMAYFNEFETRHLESGAIQAKVPHNANAVLCQGELNRYYMRAVCLEAILREDLHVTAYRARASSRHRPLSDAIDGTDIDASKLLEELRSSVGKYDKNGLLGEPNSGMSVKLK